MKDKLKTASIKLFAARHELEYYTKEHTPHFVIRAIKDIETAEKLLDELLREVDLK